MAVSKNIKGITIEFSGDTTKLGKALKNVEKDARGVDTQLKQVDRALKFNPGNTELLAQKQQLLGQRVDETKKKLNLLKDAQAKLDDDPAVDKTSQDYMSLRREIIETESKLKHFIAEGKKFDQMLNPLHQVGEKMKEVGGKAEALGQKLAPLSAAAAAVDAALAGLAYKGATTADDLNTLSKVTGIGTDKLQMYALAADLVDVSVETIAKAQTKMKKSMLSASEGTGSAAEAWQKLGVSVVDANGNLRDQDSVFQETLAALGQMENETERDALAMTLFGKSATELNPLIEDAGQTYKNVADTFAQNDLELVDQETIDKANQFNDEIDKVKATGMLALQTLGMELAGSLVPVIEKVSAGLQKFFGWLSNLSPETLKVIGVIAGLVAALAPVLIIVGKLITSIGMILTYAPVIGAAFSALAGPIGIVAAAIAAAIAIGVALYKNWDKIKKAASTLKEYVLGAFKALKDGVKRLFGDIKDAMITPIEAARDAIKEIIKKIKGFFDFDFKLPKIKTPHFSIDPPGWSIGDLLHGVIPDLNVDWYAKGGIFRSPSVIGVGEAGPEAVLPIDRLQSMLNGMADNIVNGILMGGQLQTAGTGGEIKIINYLYPNGPAMGEQTVKMYDQYKRILG